MKKDRLLNPEIISAIASLGHTEYFCIADCGLPIPQGVKVIDVSLVGGNPSFLAVVDAVKEELVVESTILASEMDEKNPGLSQQMQARFGELPCRKIPHAQFKELTKGARCIIRTGENTPYANVIFVGGVNF